MKIFSISTFLLSILLSIAFSDLKSQNSRIFDPSNARDGESVEYCFQHKKMSEILKSPIYKQLWENDKIEFQKALDNDVPKGVVYKIPVVFHILHNNGIENISDEQVFDAISIMNRDFRRLNSDAA